MMRFIAVLVAASGLAAVAPAEFAVTIAPDQPIPHVYVDDVLVLEIASDRDVAAHVRVAISDAAGAEEPALDSDMPLRAQGIRWIPLENVALRRGRYIARVTIEAGGETSESTHPFCRIDRPASVQAPPVGATIDTPEPYAMLAMRDLPLHKVCFAANSPELATLVEAAVQGLGITLQPDFIVEAALAAGRIETVLEDFPQPELGIYALLPGNRHVPHRVRVLMDYLAGGFRPLAAP